MTYAAVIQSAASSDAVGQGNLAEQAHPDARWRCVAGSHLTYADDVAAFFLATVYQADTHLDGLLHLFLCHCRLMKEITCAEGYLAVDDTWHAGQIMIHAHVHDAQVETMLSAEHVHASTATGEVHHLLPGHLTGGGTHAFLLYAVVTAQQQVAGMCQPRLHRLLHQTYLQGQLFQPAQCSFRFVEVVNLSLDGCLHPSVNGFYLKCSHSHLIFTAMPLTISSTSSARRATY